MTLRHKQVTSTDTIYPSRHYRPRVWGEFLFPFPLSPSTPRGSLSHWTEKRRPRCQTLFFRFPPRRETHHNSVPATLLSKAKKNVHYTVPVPVPVLCPVVETRPLSPIDPDITAPWRNSPPAQGKRRIVGASYKKLVCLAKPFVFGLFNDHSSS